MSYDLAVWYSATSLTTTTAQNIYKQIYRGKENVVTANERLPLFLQELVLTYPVLESLPEIEQINSPWDKNIDMNHKYALFHIRWNRAEELSAFIEALALKHYLIFFNPQNQKLSLPEHLIKRPRIKKRWWHYIFG